MIDIRFPLEFINTIYLGDTLAYLQSLPSNSVDLIVSSPPYNLGKDYEARRALDIYLDEQRLVLNECARILSSKGSLFWQVGSYSNAGTLIPLDVRFFPILEDAGLIPRNRIAWARQHGLHARKKFSCGYETILWFTKSGDYVFNLEAIRVPQKYQNKKAWRGDRKGEFTCNPNGKNPGNIWMFRNVKHNHEEQTLHPCQFPEDLIARIFLLTSNTGDVVLDPYMGVGTVAVVAQEEGRLYAGAELDSQYHDIALRRIKGIPDDNGSFPNLKTLRAYVHRMGADITKYCFDVQVGRTASDRNKAKIFSEQYHLAEMEERISFEEKCFGADRRGEERPLDAKRNGNGRPHRGKPMQGDFLGD